MQKNILIIGSGGREYSIALALKSDPRVGDIYIAPGNGASKIKFVNIDYNNHVEVVKICKDKNINLVIIGPEDPIIQGLSNVLRENNIPCFAPSKEAGMLEGSKAFMKDFATACKIPTASYIQSDDIEKISSFIDGIESSKIVVKADGLCAGKGVIITDSKLEAKKIVREMLEGKSFGVAGKRVVVEEYLEGFELSVFAMSNGKDYVILPIAQDHKRLLDEDNGPNTGGMGAYAPTPMCSSKLLARIDEDIIKKTIDGMSARGTSFCGTLFGGIMVVEKDGEQKPYLLEFNVRLGDPECEVLMPLLGKNALDVFLFCAGVKSEPISAQEVENLESKLKCMEGRVSVSVVIASRDYPYKSSIPQIITIKDFDKNLGHIVYAGVSEKDGVLLASGGRVIVAVGVASTLDRAQTNAYKIVESIHFEGMQFRKDIAARGLNFLKNHNVAQK